MHKTLLVLTALIAYATLAYAQQPAPADQTQFLSSAVQALQAQRNAAQDQAAQVQAQNALLQGKLAEVQKELDALRAKDAPPPGPAVNVQGPPKEAPAK